MPNLLLDATIRYLDTIGILDKYRLLPIDSEKPQAPATDPTFQCKSCWDKDYEKEINVNASGRYYNRYQGSVVNNYSERAKYKLSIPLKSGGDVTVTIRFKVAIARAATPADAAIAQANLVTAVSGTWNGKLNLRINDPCCGEKTLPIRFVAEIVEANQHFTLRVYDNYDFPEVTNTALKIASNSDPWVYVHEFGHCFGLTDEYGHTPQLLESVKYYQPNGKLGSSIRAPYLGKIDTSPEANIMSTHGNYTVVKHHGWPIAIEARKLINAGKSRTITCEIV